MRTTRISGREENENGTEPPMKGQMQNENVGDRWAGERVAGKRVRGRNHTYTATVKKNIKLLQSCIVCLQFKSMFEQLNKCSLLVVWWIDTRIERENVECSSDVEKSAEESKLNRAKVNVASVSLCARYAVVYIPMSGHVHDYFVLCKAFRILLSCSHKRPTTFRMMCICNTVTEQNNLKKSCEPIFGIKSTWALIAAHFLK